MSRGLYNDVWVLLAPVQWSGRKCEVANSASTTVPSVPSPVERKHGGRRFLVEKRTMKGTSSPNAGPDGTGRVSVFQKDGNTYTVEPNGASILHFADRCPTLTDIPEDQGHTVLPFSRVALRLWQEAVPCAAARAVPSIRQPVWGLPRLQDLCTVVQVAEFLRDDGVRAWAVDSLADLLRAEIDPLWSDTGHEKRINADMRPSVLTVCEAVAGLHNVLQTYVVFATRIPLSVLACIIPQSMLALLVQHHFTSSGKLDLSKQLIRCNWAQSSAQSSAPPPAPLKSPLAMLGAHVTGLQKLRSLDMAGNDFTPADAPFLARILMSHSSTLQNLSLKGGNQTLFVQRADRVMWPPLGMCIFLTSLDLSHNGLATSALDHLLPALANLQRLEVLNLRACSLHGELAEVLCYSLRGLVCLRQVDLGHNSLGHPSFLQLAHAVRNMVALEDLDVTQTNPDLTGMACLLAAASCAPSIHSFSAEDCKVYSWVPQPAWPSPRVTRCSAEQLLRDCLSAFSDASARSAYLHARMQTWSNTTLQARNDANGDLNVQMQNIAGNTGLRLNGRNEQRELTTSDVLTSEQTCPEDEEKRLLPKPTSQLKVVNMRAALGSYLGPLSELISLSLMNVVTVEQGGRTSIEIADDDVHSRVHPNSACVWKPVDLFRSVEELNLGSLSFLQVPTFLLAAFFGSLQSLQHLSLQEAAFDQGALWDVFHTLGQKISNSAVVGLTALCLSNHPMTAGELVAVCRVVTLRKLTLNHCTISARKAAAFGSQLNRLTGMTSLDLSGNALERDGRGAVLAGAVRLTSLRHLHGGSAFWSERDIDLQAGRSMLGENVAYSLEGRSTRSMEEEMW